MPIPIPVVCLQPQSRMPVAVSVLPHLSCYTPSKLQVSLLSAILIYSITYWHSELFCQTNTQCVNSLWAGTNYFKRWGKQHSSGERRHGKKDHQPNLEPVTYALSWSVSHTSHGISHIPLSHIGPYVPVTGVLHPRPCKIRDLESLVYMHIHLGQNMLLFLRVLWKLETLCKIRSIWRHFRRVSNGCHRFILCHDIILFVLEHSGDVSGSSYSVIRRHLQVQHCQRCNYCC